MDSNYSIQAYRHEPHRTSAMELFCEKQLTAFCKKVSFQCFLNKPLKLVEYNLNIFLMLFELKKIVLIDFHFVVFTDDIFLYLQFILCAFCSDLSETLNIMKSIFDV